jgi:hypothetical protein
MLAAAVIVPMADPPTARGKFVAYAFAASLILATLGLANPSRFRWALRAVAGMVLLACVGYLGSEVVGVIGGKPLGLGGRRGDTNLVNAFLAALIFGVPAARFMLSGHSGTAADTLTDEGHECDDSEKAAER